MNSPKSKIDESLSIILDDVCEIFECERSDIQKPGSMHNYVFVRQCYIVAASVINPFASTEKIGKQIGRQWSAIMNQRRNFLTSKDFHKLRYFNLISLIKELESRHPDKYRGLSEKTNHYIKSFKNE
jgi:hypothetical protein